MNRQKKVKIFLVVMVVLYLVAASYGLTRDDGAMGEAMATVKEKVADARRKIKKEMDKPFILRLFGSLFSMEGNTLEELKEELPTLLKSAMPEVLTSFTTTEPASPVACKGMRLVDALLYLQEKEVPLEELRWGWDPTLAEEVYLKLPGTILDAAETPSGGARLVLQYDHPYVGEDGLGDSASKRQDRLRRLEEEVRSARDRAPRLFVWLIQEDPSRLGELTSGGFPTARWCDTRVPFVASGGE